MKLKEIMHIVERYLQDHPHLRDDDNKLIASIWKHHLKNQFGFAIHNMSSIQLLELIADGKMINAQSITRARRKLQELVPAYRGKKYMERMAEAAKVKSEITKM